VRSETIAEAKTGVQTCPRPAQRRAVEQPGWSLQPDNLTGCSSPHPPRTA